MKKYTTIYSFTYEDFIHPHRFAFDDIEEIECDVYYDMTRAFAGTYWEPPEPATVEDVAVFLDGTDITAAITDAALDDLIDFLLEDHVDEDDRY